MIDFLRKHNVGISIFLTIIAVVVMTWITTSSLWITIPFALCVILSDDVIDGGNYYGHAVFAGVFWIVLDVFAFRTNTWFGIVFIVLCIAIFIGSIVIEALDEKLHIGLITSIVLYNIGKAIFHEWSIYEYALPSLIGSVILLIEGGYLGEYLYKQSERNARNRIENQKVQAQEEYRKKYVTEDMERIEKLLGIGKYDIKNLMKGRTVNYEVFDNQPIPSKIFSLQNFNSKLQKTINEYAAKADRIIEEAYKNVLRTNSTNNLFWNYGNISQRFSSSLNPVLAAACDASVKKISAFVQQKQDIINKNNADIAKYNQLIQKLQKQYDDELALQKIKELNRDVNSQMEDISDIENKEIKNSEFQNIISDIDLLDKEVNERRQYEIQFGQIEI